MNQLNKLLPRPLLKLSKFVLPKNSDERDGLPYWREKILNYLLLTLMIFALLAYIPSVILSITENFWTIAVLDTLVYAVVIYIFFSPRLSVRLRSMPLLFASYILGVFLLVIVGPYGAGYLWMFVVPIIAAILIEQRIAYFSVALNAATLTVLGLLYHHGVIRYRAAFDFSIGSWLAISSNFLFLEIIVTVALGVIIRGLENTLVNEKDISNSLESKSKELIKAKEKAERADSMKSEFLAQMSHEIRTPINTILSFVSLIKEETKSYETEEMKDYFSMIEKGSTRVIRTIDMILNMSEIQSGNFEPKIESIVLSKEVLAPLAGEFSKVAANKNLRLIFNPDSEGNTAVKTDRYAATQIFANLIDNAIKYTNRGSIEININSRKNAVLVEISDTGIGMSKEYLANIFKPFTQEESGYTRRFEGTGLGLALVKKYCDLGGGSISVESAKDRGTTFTVGFAAHKSM